MLRFHPKDGGLETITDTAYADALARYQSLVADATGDKVKGKANPYTSMNGNMFSFLDKTGTLCLRLSGEDRNAFVAAFSTGLVVQYGAVMKEYVAVPSELAADLSALEDWFSKCLTCAQSLPAKPTRKK